MFDGVYMTDDLRRVLELIGFVLIEGQTATLMFRAVATMRDTLAALRAHATGAAPLQPAANAAESRRILDDALDLDRWRHIEAQAASPDPSEPPTRRT